MHFRLKNSKLPLKVKIVIVIYVYIFNKSKDRIGETLHIDTLLIVIKINFDVIFCILYHKSIKLYAIQVFD